MIIPTLIGIATVVFIIVRLAPGNPAEILLGDYATPEALAYSTRKWGSIGLSSTSMPSTFSSYSRETSGGLSQQTARSCRRSSATCLIRSNSPLPPSSYRS